MSGKGTWLMVDPIYSENLVMYLVISQSCNTHFNFEDVFHKIRVERKFKNDFEMKTLGYNPPMEPER